MFIMSYLNKNKISTLLEKILYAVVLLSLPITLTAQPQNYDLKEIARQYKNEQAVMLNSSDRLVIDFDKKNNLQVTNHHYHDVFFTGINSKLSADEYLSYSSFEKLNDIEAYLYQYDGKHYKKQKITEMVNNDDFSNSVFYDDRKSMRVVFPQVNEGSYTSISYSETYSDVHLCRNLFFLSSYLPIVNSQLSVEFPENVNIHYTLLNDKGNIHFSEQKKGKKIIYTWKAEKVDNYDRREEDFSITYYEPHIVLYVSDYTVNGKKTNVFNNINGFYDWYWSLIKDVNKEPVPELKTLVDSLCRDKKNELDKAKAIFYWVQSNIKYVAFEAGYSGLVPRHAKDIFKNRYGDCKDMSSLQKMMYDYAGLKSHLVCVGTRDIPYKFSELPTVSVFNHMIAHVEIDGREYFTDGTAFFIPIDLPSDAIQGKEALIVDGEKFRIKTIPVIDKEKNTKNDTLWLTINADTLKGTSHQHLCGYPGLETGASLLITPRNKWKEYATNHFSRGSNKFKVESVRIDTIDRDRELFINTTFSIPNYVKNAGGNYYVNMNLDRSYQNDKVDTSKQKFDKSFDYKHVIQYCTNLNIPEGYKLGKMPSGSVFNDSQFGFKSAYTFDPQANKIQYSFYLYIDAIAIKPEKFDSWNEMVKKLAETYSQVVVFEKINK